MCIIIAYEVSAELSKKLEVHPKMEQGSFSNNLFGSIQADSIFFYPVMD